MRNEELTELFFFKPKFNLNIEFYSYNYSSKMLNAITVEETNRKSFLMKYTRGNFICYPLLTDSAGTMVITTERIKHLIPVLFPNNSSAFIYVPEYINCNGTVVENLLESEMNKILKLIYSAKPKKVLIHLLNGIKNPLHEKMFYNVLKVAGYEVCLSGDGFLKSEKC